MEAWKTARDLYQLEVRTPPLLLAALVGAAPLHSQLTEALHESAVGACGQKRTKYLSYANYEVPIPACKRGGKDAPGYKVEGILRRKWLEKVCNELPAVLVLCFDWSATVNPPPGEEALAVLRLQEARRTGRDRELRLLTLLVLHDDVVDPEALCAMLRQQPEASGLVVARGVGDITLKAQKLERLIYQHAMAFYADEEKRHRKVRTPSVTMPISSQHALQVRTSFKLGFLSEFRRDARGALNNYIKAYEQLIQDTELAELAGVVERMDLCNHITIRMYQLYLQSHDVNAAVHHCRIHTATLRTLCAGDDVQIWHKWVWLSNNHELFAQLLENVAQQLPLLIDQSDMWQFPGFHYQSAAAYAGQLVHWAERVMRDRSVPAPSGDGGSLVIAAYVGQVESLQEPSTCADPTLEVQHRLATQQVAALQQHRERQTQLLAQARAACKERQFNGGSVACTMRTAEGYFSAGRYEWAWHLYDRLGRAPAEDGGGDGGGKSGLNATRPLWPALKRIAVARAIICSCRLLGLTEEPRLSCSPPAPRGSTSVEGEQATNAQEVCSRLLRDSFAYLDASDRVSEHDRAGGTATNVCVNEATSLFQAVVAALSHCAAHNGEATGAPDVVFGSVAGSSELRENVGGSSNSMALVLNLRHTLPVPLEIRLPATASTSNGEVRLHSGSMEKGTVQWDVGGALELQGAWPTKDRADVQCVRLRWAVPASPHADDAGAPVGAILTVRDIQAASVKVSKLVSPFRLPFGILEDRPREAHEPSAAAVVKRDCAASLRVELFTPMDPGDALLTEQFIFHVIIYSRIRGVDVDAGLRGKLRLSCAVEVHEELAEPSPEQPPHQYGDAPEVSVISAAPPLGDSGNEPWPLLLVSGGSEQVIAGVATDGRLSGNSSVASLRLPHMAGNSHTPSNGSKGRSTISVRTAILPRLGANEDALAVPVAVRVGAPGENRTCRVIITPQMQLQEEAEPGIMGDGSTIRVPVAQMTLRFRPAFEMMEDNGFGSLGPRVPSTNLPRRFTLKSLASTATVRLASVAAEVSGASARLVPVLGALGDVHPGAIHAVALPPSAVAGGEKATLVARFCRADAAAAFAPWASMKDAPAADIGCATSSSGGQRSGIAAILAAATSSTLLPEAVSTWPLSEETQKGASAVAVRSTAPFHVDLEHVSTGTVAEAIEVRVRVTRKSTDEVEELKVRIMQGENGEGSDKYFISGPTSTQAMPSLRNEEFQVCTSFMLLPLRPGWISLPRVQVSIGHLEVSSVPAHVFVFPAAQPALWRSSS